jgi:sugar phosphate isomerase/epimerase
VGSKTDDNGCQSQPEYGPYLTRNFLWLIAWWFVYPWPQRPAGLVDTAFTELANRWKPILDSFDEAGVNVGYELHPGEDLFDGITFEMFLEKVNNHPRAGINYDPSHFLLQQLDYLQFIDFYHERIYAFHVKDAEFNPSGKQGVYSGYQGWVNRAGRFRSLGDGTGRLQYYFQQTCTI